MARPIAEHALFKTKAPTATTKAAITDNAARTIIGEEAVRREAKTARLRQARLESEAKVAELAASEDAKPKKPASKRRAKPKA